MQSLIFPTQKEPEGRGEKPNERFRACSKAPVVLFTLISTTLEANVLRRYKSQA